MAGEIKKMIDAIIAKRSRGVTGLIYTTKAKLLLKGVDPDAYDENSPDNPAILEKVRQFASELGVDITNSKQSQKIQRFAREIESTISVAKKR